MMNYGGTFGRALAVTEENMYELVSSNKIISTGIRSINLNANNVNSVYTDSGKVYPQSLALNFIIKI